MYLKAVTIFSLIPCSLALPILSAQNYSQFQVSDGLGGNALAEVSQKFPIAESNLANVDAQDLAILKAAGMTAEQAEVGKGGFNEAIDAAGGKNTAAGKALQVGKIKNKVLKLQLSVLSLGVDVARGRQDRAAKLQDQKTNLAKNVALDKEAAGQTSTPVNFQGSSQP